MKKIVTVGGRVPSLSSWRWCPASCGVPVFDCKNVCKNIENRENIEVL